MGTSVISGLVGGAVAVIICTAIASKVRGAAADGQLRFGWGLFALGTACLAPVAFSVWGLFYDYDVWEKRSELLSVIGLFGIGLFGAVFSFGEYFMVRGTYDAEGIEFYTPWTGHKKEKWLDLASVEFNDYMYVLRFKSGRIVRLSSLLSGHGGVLDILERLGHDV